MGDEVIGKIEDLGERWPTDNAGARVGNAPLKKPPTRIEKLGELYDAAIERIAERTADVNNDLKQLEQKEHDFGSNNEAEFWLRRIESAHQIDMQVIQTYLQETKRPERESVNVPPADASGQIPKLYMETDEGTFTLSENAQWMFTERT